MRNHKTILTLLAVSLLTAACFDSDEVNYVHYTCEDPPHDSDDSGRCYVYREGWAAWAQTLTYAEAAQMELDGVIVPSERDLGDADCWRPAASYAPTLCIVQVDGVDVLGRPLEEMGDATFDAQCAGVFPWESTLSRGLDCFADVDGFAVLLDTERAIP